MKAVKYGAIWCGPCRQMKENLIEAGINFTEVDVDEYPDIADAKGITNIPVIEFIDEHGNVLYKATGLLSVEELINIKKKYE